MSLFPLTAIIPLCDRKQTRTLGKTNAANDVIVVWLLRLLHEVPQNYAEQPHEDNKHE